MEFHLARYFPHPLLLATNERIQNSFCLIKILITCETLGFRENQKISKNNSENQPEWNNFAISKKSFWLRFPGPESIGDSGPVKSWSGRWYVCATRAKVSPTLHRDFECMLFFIKSRIWISDNLIWSISNLPDHCKQSNGIIFNAVHDLF